MSPTAAGNEFKYFMAVPLSGEVETVCSVSSPSAEEALIQLLRNSDLILTGYPKVPAMFEAPSILS